MGSCMSSESSGDAEQKKRSQMIDRRLEEDQRRLRRECKILLLGSGESGKSTIVKQMKIIHQNGYTVEELALYRLTVYKNLIDCAKALIDAYHHFQLEPSSQKVKDYMAVLEEYQVDTDPNTPLDGSIGDAVTYLWNDPCTSTVLERQNEFYLMDSAPYFFEEAKRITAPDYIPNVSDVLRARTKTTGIYETRFTMGQLSIHMFDVGGQRSERKKWIHCFENVTSIIFCVALSEYDQTLLEESNQNRMMESLVLFDSVLPRSPLSNYFPDYSGGNDVNRAAKYLLWRFNQVNRAHLNLYPHLTQATDTTNIRLVFAAVKETILQNALKDSGIL
ncbi:Guanine nucleotide-binding protein alpha-3 subunit [Penicillium oxalicum]|uniref:Guanine nucleotide-binding protein alpha-3 subunit n=1 Tax=Penicillium oxalicum TaxID=69781 RepID=UPI0020B66109|nr:Guanine nucleotide-binding protein alpha-3 subunit [Penicillium oxalicum]KAI2790746.1 Guanine nucleotide-binding protein alpha-3 subunit [Penicillium oxalicum]